VPPLVAAAGDAVGAAPPMTLRLAGAGRFGPVRRPQVFWAGLDGDVEPLIDLAQRPVAEVRLIESHLGGAAPYETVAAWPVA
jgi:2'-5' RNA ligase